MKFRSPTEDSVPVGLTTGHTALVTAEGTELADMFHREAIARGCVPFTESDAFNEKKQQNPEFTRSEVIGTAIEALIKAQDKDDFTAAGKVDLNRLSAKVGFKVSREEADALWTEITQDQS
jgi:hypothetical protein